MPTHRGTWDWDLTVRGLTLQDSSLVDVLLDLESRWLRLVWGTDIPRVHWKAKKPHERPWAQ
jgi:hypothetical protein